MDKEIILTPKMIKAIQNAPDWCQAVKKNGKKCGNYAIKGGTLCHSHTPNDETLCAGTKRDGTKCCKPHRKGSLYCTDDHDPAFVRSSDPSYYRISGLRDHRLTQVLRSRDYTDGFTGDKIEPEKKKLQGYDIDHIIEINLGRDMFDRLKEIKKSDANRLKDDIKVTFNQNFNLIVTEMPVNMAKTAAMQKFALAYRKDDVNKDGIKHYLRESFVERTSRNEISRICEEVITSGNLIKDYMNDNFNSSKVVESYVSEIEDMMVALRIK